MNLRRLTRLPVLLAVFLCGAVGLAGEPVYAKKKGASEAYAAQKQAKRTAASKCRRGPVPPFMRNPRFMNRGFLKRRC